MADTENEVIGKAMGDGAAGLDGIMNPQQYASGLNNPLAKGLLAAYSGLKGGLSLPRMSGTGGDIAAILGGAMGAQQAEQDLARQQLEMAPLSMVSPQLAEAFPEVADMPNKQAYDLIGKLQNYFSQKMKGRPLDEEDLPSIVTSLRLKGITKEGEAEEYAKTFLGQTWDVVKNVPKKTGLSDFEETEPQLVSMANGMQAYKIRTRSGYRYQIVPGQVMTETDRSRLALVKQAMSATDRLVDALNSPRAQELMLKAGHSWKKLSSLGDTEAQKLAKDIFLAADARARIVTGAAINRDEMDLYFNNLIPAVGTKEANISNIQKEQEFFNDYLTNLSYGKNVPASVRPATPKAEPVPKKDEIDKMLDDVFK